MKQNFLKWMVCMCFGLLSVATVMAGGNYKTVKVKAPFPMQPIKVFIYPDRDFKITDFGAVPGGDFLVKQFHSVSLTGSLGLCRSG